MILSLYLARRFLQMVLGVGGVFFGILFMIDMIEQIRRTGGASLAGAAWLAALNVPQGFYAILPLVVILGAIALFLAMARSSELVVMRAAGRSALRALAAPVVTALLLGALAVAALNPIVAATQRQYEAQSSKIAGDAGSVLSVGQEGLWLRQGGGAGQTVIRAARSNLDGTELYGATFLLFDPDRGPARRLEAATATLGPGGWQLRDVKDWPLSGSDNPERDARHHDSLSLPSDLTADRIRDSFGTPASIPIWQLPAFIAALQEAGFSARRHAVWLQMELAQPVIFAAMVLLAAGFTMRHARFGRSGVMVLFALGAGLALFFLRNFAQVLGENGQIPVALAAWAPPLAAVLLSLGLLLHLEDG